MSSPSPLGCHSGFPGGSDGKESACNVGDLGSIPVLGRSPGGGHGNPLQYSCLENPHGQRSLAGYSTRGRKEADTNKHSTGCHRAPDLSSLHHTAHSHWLSILHMVMFISSVQLFSHVRLSDPMDCSIPGLPVHHQLPELAQTHVHPVSDASQWFHLLSSSPPTFNLSQHQSFFQWVSSSHQAAKVLELQL